MVPGCSREHRVAVREGARRIDSGPRMADKYGPFVFRDFGAPLGGDPQGDFAAGEWEVLTMIDGAKPARDRFVLGASGSNARTVSGCVHGLLVAVRRVCDDEPRSSRLRDSVGVSDVLLDAAGGVTAACTRQHWPGCERGNRRRARAICAESSKRCPLHVGAGAHLVRMHRSEPRFVPSAATQSFRRRIRQCHWDSCNALDHAALARWLARGSA